MWDICKNTGLLAMSGINTVFKTNLAKTMSVTKNPTYDGAWYTYHYDKPSETSDDWRGYMGP